MTKKELLQLFYLNRIITSDKKQIWQWETAWGRMILKLHSITSQDNCESTIIVPRLEEIKISLKNNIKKRNKKKEILSQYIENIDDTEMRQIMYFRYMKGFTWQKIAFEIGYQDESVPRKRHNRYLEKEECSNEELFHH